MNAAPNFRRRALQGLGVTAIVATCFLPLLAGSRFVARAQQRDALKAQPHVEAASAIEAGRYLVMAGGCNDCHTPGFMEKGTAPESEWLTGVPVGWRGPWGTTYPSNLRLFVQETPEDLFLQILRTRKANPPMPWSTVNVLSEQDARALYRYIKSLGVRGERMPAALGPGDEPKGPYLDMMPKNLPAVAQASAQ